MSTEERIEILRSMVPNPNDYYVMSFDNEAECDNFKSRLSKFNNSEGVKRSKYIHAHIPKGKLTAYLVCVSTEEHLASMANLITRYDWRKKLKKN